MEKIMQVKAQAELRENAWQNTRGENMIIASVELELTDGLDTIVAEVTGDDARALAANPAVPGTTGYFALRFGVSEVKTRDGKPFKTMRCRVQAFSLYR